MPTQTRSARTTRASCGRGTLGRPQRSLLPPSRKTSTSPGQQTCRRRLHPAGPRRPPDAEPPATVLFCDLVGSTALSAQLDPEELREVVRAYQDTCAKVIARFDGHIAQYLGDGLLVYFGYPRAHEMMRSGRSGGAGDGGGPGATGHAPGAARGAAAVRLGIHTGLVVVGEIGVARGRNS